MMCRINPKVDFAFKKLFGSEENKDILMAFINSVLEESDQSEPRSFEPITYLTIKNPYNLASYQKGKMTILDIKAQDDKGVWYDIEMQIAEQGFYDKRAFYYWAKMYTDQLENGQGFIELRKTIGINILDFNFSDEPDYHNMYRIYNAKTHNQLSDLFELHFVELSKFSKGLTEMKTALDRWVTFLNRAYEYSTNKMPTEIAADQYIKKAVEQLDAMSLTGEEREYYENDLKRYLVDQAVRQTAEQKGMEMGMEKGMEMGIEMGIEKGVELGIEQAKLDVARNLLIDGMTIEQVARVTGLSMKDIESLSNQSSGNDNRI